MQGLHLIADLRGCDARAAPMLDAAALRTLCLEAVAAAGLGRVADLFHAFAPTPAPADAAQPAGITGVVLLAESHLAVHTWPELGAVTLDVYVCNFGADNSARAQDLMNRLVAAFAPQQAQQRALRRGD